MNCVLNKTDLNVKYEILPAVSNPGVYANLINLHYRTSYIPYSRQKDDLDVREADFPAVAPRDSRCTR